MTDNSDNSDNSSTIPSSRVIHDENVHLIEEGRFVPVRKSHHTLGICILCICIASFVIETELAQFVNKGMKYHKPYFFLWVAHSCYIIILPLQLMFILNPLRYMEEFLNIGIGLISTVKPTYQAIITTNPTEEDVEYDHPMVVTSITQILTSKHYRPVMIYIFKISLLFAIIICTPGYIWYVAVNLTTMAKLTAIYNTSCFWAYVFSIILLKETIRIEKVFSVILSITGVMVMSLLIPNERAHNIEVGDFIACFGALVYGLYEVLYKKLGSPPTTSFLFANTITGLIGLCTLLFLWIPIPILHYLGIEIFELPDPETFGYILSTAIAGVFFNASFMLLIALTSPLFASVGIMLTIPVVALVDWLITNTPIGVNTIIGNLCILLAFILLIWTNIKDKIRYIFLKK